MVLCYTIDGAGCAVVGFKCMQSFRSSMTMSLLTGILSDVLGYVVQHCNGSLFMEDALKQKMVECLDFLRALACKNTAIQTKYVKQNCTLAAFFSQIEHFINQEETSKIIRDLHVPLS